MHVKKENASHVEGHDDHNAISSSVSSERPRNYLFKIESFSLLREALTKTKLDKCDSCQFAAGGYKWKLSVYPNGDKKRGGDGYISLYLALADPKSLPQGDEVHVFFKFFVYDDLRDAYLVLQDGKERRFHTLKTELGYAKLLPLEIFNDPCRGYLVDDCCAFGVELFFHKDESKAGSTLSIKNTIDPDESTFTWKIDKFSTLPELHTSDAFSIDGRKWTLQFHPKGDSRAKGICLSLFLNVHDHSSLPCGWNFYAVFKLSILDQLNQKHHERTGYNWFSKTGTGWGFSDFIRLSDLKNESRGFVVKDSVVIQVTIMSIFVYNSMP